MKSQKQFPAVLVMLILSALAFLGPVGASADISVNWSFYLETYGEPDEDGPTATFIDPGYLQYPYDWDLTGVEARLEVNQQWYDLFDDTPEEDKSGSGILPGPFPVPEDPEEDDWWLVHHIDANWITADIFVSVDASGYGTLAIDNITFGQLESWDVDGAKFWVDVMVTPEPSTLLLLGLGAVILRSKR